MLPLHRCCTEAHLRPALACMANTICLLCCGSKARTAFRVLLRNNVLRQLGILTIIAGHDDETILPPATSHHRILQQTNMLVELSNHASVTTPPPVWVLLMDWHLIQSPPRQLQWCVNSMCGKNQHERPRLRLSSMRCDCRSCLGSKYVVYILAVFSRWICRTSGRMQPYTHQFTTGGA